MAGDWIALAAVLVFGLVLGLTLLDGNSWLRAICLFVRCRVFALTFLYTHGGVEGGGKLVVFDVLSAIAFGLCTW